MPSGLYLQVWAKKGSKSRSTYLDHWQGLDAVVASNRAADVYVGCAAVAKRLGATVRGKAKDAAAICGVWSDLDVGPGHASDVDAAIEAAHVLAEPSAIVGSGGGVHAWWKFDEPWVFADEEERAEAALLCASWVETLRQRISFRLDSVGELARVLRLPGSFNHKQEPERPVELLSSPGGSFPRQQLAELSGPHRRRSAAAREGSDEASEHWVEIPPAEVPWELLARLRSASDLLDRTWTMQRKDVAAQGWSASQWDQSIASQLASSGCTRWQACALTMQFRREHGDEKGKLGRPDYWTRTIRTAFNGTSAHRVAEEAQAEEVELVAELRELRETPIIEVEATRTDRWAKLNQLVGGGVGGAPRVVEWHQYGTDPELARHVWALSDGVEAPLGSGLGVLAQARVKHALMSVSSIFRAGDWKKQTWELGIATVLPLRTFHDDPEAEREQRAREWVSQVTTERSVESDPGSINEAIILRRPFRRDGQLFIAQGYLGQQLRLQRIAQDVKDTDLPPMLRAAGFERMTVNFDKPEGSRGSRSYWSIDDELLP